MRNVDAFKVVLALATCLTLAACGGERAGALVDGKQDKPLSREAAVLLMPMKTGVLDEGLVQGLSARSLGVEGPVRADGLYLYREGSQVTLFLGAIELGSAQGSPTLSLSDLHSNRVTNELNFVGLFTAPHGPADVPQALGAALGEVLGKHPDLPFNLAPDAFREHAEVVAALATAQTLLGRKLELSATVAPDPIRTFNVRRFLLALSPEGEKARGRIEVDPKVVEVAMRVSAPLPFELPPEQFDAHPTVVKLLGLFAEELKRPVRMLPAAEAQQWIDVATHRGAAGKT